MPGGRRGLVAPQNTFLENIIRRSSQQRKSNLSISQQADIRGAKVPHGTVVCNNVHYKPGPLSSVTYYVLRIT